MWRVVETALEGKVSGRWRQHLDEYQTNWSAPLHWVQNLDTTAPHVTWLLILCKFPGQNLNPIYFEKSTKVCNILFKIICTSQKCRYKFILNEYFCNEKLFVVFLYKSTSWTPFVQHTLLSVLYHEIFYSWNTLNFRILYLV